MYFYIFEAPKSSGARRTQEKVKFILGDLGIAGETLVPSPARTIEDLVNIALDKNYTTIVAAGSDRHLNKVASILKILGQNKIALGLIPLDKDSLIALQINADHLVAACENLKYRRLKTFGMTCLEPNKYFLTETYIHTGRPQPFRIDLNSGLSINSELTDIIVNAKSQILLANTRSSNNLLSRFSRWFLGKDQKDIDTSIFRSHQIRIQSTPSLPIVLHQEIIAKTPVVFHYLPNALQIIVGRDTVKPERNH